MIGSNQRFGALGEKLAARYLKEQGYKILKKNYKNKLGEIDIIAVDKIEIVFVEVKTRTSDEHYDPLKAITRAKRRHMVASANGYLKYYQLKCGIVYDVMIVIGQPGAFQIQYIPRAFLPELRTYR